MGDKAHKYHVYQTTHDERRVYFCSNETLSHYGWLEKERAENAGIRPVEYIAKDLPDIIKQQLKHDLCTGCYSITIETVKQNHTTRSVVSRLER